MNTLTKLSIKNGIRDSIEECSHFYYDKLIEVSKNSYNFDEEKINEQTSDAIICYFQHVEDLSISKFTLFNPYLKERIQEIREHIVYECGSLKMEDSLSAGGVFVLVCVAALDEYPENYECLELEKLQFETIKRIREDILEELESDDGPIIIEPEEDDEGTSESVYEADEDQPVIDFEEVSKGKDIKNDEVNEIEQDEPIELKSDKPVKKRKTKKILITLAIVFVIMPFCLKKISPYLMPKISYEDALGVWALEGIESDGTFYTRDGFLEKYDVAFDMLLFLGENDYASAILTVDGEVTEDTTGVWYYKGHTIVCEFDDGSFSTLYKTEDDKLAFTIKVDSNKYKFHLEKMSEEELNELIGEE